MKVRRTVNTISILELYIEYRHIFLHFARQILGLAGRCRSNPYCGFPGSVAHGVGVLNTKLKCRFIVYFNLLEG